MVWSGCRKTGIFFTQFALSMRRRKLDFRVSAPCTAATSSRGIPTWAFAITPPPPFAASTCVAAHRISSCIAHPEINTDSPLRGERGSPARAAFCEGGHNRNEHPETITRSTMARTREHKLISRPDGQGEFYDLRKDPRELNNLFGDKAMPPRKRRWSDGCSIGTFKLLMWRPKSAMPVDFRLVPSPESSLDACAGLISGRNSILRVDASARR